MGDQESEAEKGEVESPNPKENKDKKEVKEETFRRMVREILLEMLDDDDKKEPEHLKTDPTVSAVSESGQSGSPSFSDKASALSV